MKLNQSPGVTTRRSFLKHSGSCGAWLLAMTNLAPSMMRDVFSGAGGSRRQESNGSNNERLFEENWGWIEKVADNAWAHIAAPFEQNDFTTVCNGGIIAGSDRVLAIESFQKPEGARWLAERARELTGRWPTDIVVSHFHGDHVSGSAGYKTDENSPQMWITETTRDLVKKDQARRDQVTLLDNLSTIDEGPATELDLGGRVVKLSPGKGHTPSDVAIEVVDPNIIFCGDLVWNRLVPNFRDAQPLKLKENVASLVREDDSIYVPGHGPLASLADLKVFQEFLNVLEDAARSAHSAGKESAVAAKEFKLSGEFADWYIFADSVMPAVFSSWYAALDEG